CAAHGIGATIGARYPARARENLVQLFTARHRDDERPLVRALTALAPRVDAMQLELAIALRWPGPWREALRAACLGALPALVGDGAASAADARPRAGETPRGPSQRLQITSPGLCVLAAVDRVGARLLLFPPEGGLLLFTGERTGVEPANTVGPLTL